MQNYLLISFIPPLFWGFTTVIEKYKLLTVLNPIEIALLRGFYLLAAVVVYTMINKKFVKKVKNLSKMQIFYLSLSIILNVTAVIVFWYILKHNKTIYPSSISSSFWIIFAVLFGYLLFDETINKFQILGIFLITLGIFFIHS